MEGAAVHKAPWLGDRDRAPLSVQLEQAERSLLVRASGEIDVSNAKLLKEKPRGALLAHDSRIVLDLSNIVRIDSTGLRTLLWVADRSSQDGNRVRIRVGSSAVQRIVEQTGVAKALPLTA
jgi:anti-anti-sigma factor